MRTFLRWIIRSVVRLIARVDISGYENLPATGAYVIATNHLGILDSAMLYLAIDRWDVFIPVAEKWEKVHILVNNAGITRDTLIPRMSDEDWDTVIDTNLRGAFLFTRAVTRPMMGNRYGRIINIASISGLMGNPGQANYSASKAGLIGMTRTVAKELASRKITVNAVAPGFIETEMTAALGPAVLEEVKKRVPAKRMGQADEVAACVLFLASGAASYITGQVLTIDGGLCA